ncbi:transcription elongation factor A protein 2-like [Convolutriloba macropyga]|uniref:transcription elongation factor A protein 2-like n=1 Tax=Convolutriloba macropyga TaxID=536237 RepID=UPI003F520A02
MCSEERVNGLKKDLERAMRNEDDMNSGKTRELLLQLKCLNMQLAVLEKTRVGMTINNLRKSTSDKQISQLCKDLIKSWKKLLSEEATAASSNSSAGAASTDSTDGPPPAKKEKSSAASSSKESSRESTPSRDPNSLSQGTKNGGDEVQSEDSLLGGDGGMRVASSQPTKNAVREKCRELICKALRENTADELVIFTDLEELSALIEDNIFLIFGDTGIKYKDRVRSKVFNLKDKKNPELKTRVIKGEISPEQLATMTPEQMASSEMKELRQKLTKEAINDHQMAVVEGTKTALIQCGKCKKSNCTYSQMQTRSADEPMTTFVFCNECGNRWKFC